MESLQELVKTLSTGILNRVLTSPAVSDDIKQQIRDIQTQAGVIDRNASEKERLERLTKLSNSTVGHLDAVDGINCQLCNNRGYSQEVKQNELFGYWYQVVVECECMNARKSWRRIQRSGLAGVLQEQTFDSFVTEETWQRNMLDKAKAFVAGQGAISFYVGGQVGCGKSHICTAICGELLKQNKSVKYMKWAEESVRLKSKVNDDDYADMLSEYKMCDVLYIDDFFKVPRKSNAQPTDADIKLAFQIIDYRYCNKLTTVISSEWLIAELCDFDEATSSRIYEMCKGSTVGINRVPGRNFRSRMQDVI